MANVKTVSKYSIAAFKAHATMARQSAAATRNRKERAAWLARAAEFDAKVSEGLAEIERRAKAMIKAKRSGKKEMTLRQSISHRQRVAAWKAHITMATKELPMLRGKARTAVKAKIADLQAKIAAAANA